jgi:hydrogenase maturation protease
LLRLKPLLVIGIGNPSRGDDALGPICIERLQALDLPDVELLTDFQLQVEYVLDLHGRDRIIFIDAAASGPEPFAFAPIQAEADTSYSSHALSPQSLLAAYARHYRQAAPPAFLLAIRGHGFDLGEPLCQAALQNLAAAQTHLLHWLGGNT